MEDSVDRNVGFDRGHIDAYLVILEKVVGFLTLSLSFVEVLAEALKLPLLSWDRASANWAVLGARCRAAQSRFVAQISGPTVSARCGQGARADRYPGRRPRPLPPWSRSVRRAGRVLQAIW